MLQQRQQRDVLETASKLGLQHNIRQQKQQVAYAQWYRVRIVYVILSYQCPCNSLTVTASL